VRIWDILDILIVAYLMYKMYSLLKGTIAFNIFIGVLTLYFVWWVVERLDMNLLSLLLGKFVGFGVLILIIIFQPEVRNFLLMLGNTALRGRLSFLKSILGDKWKNDITGDGITVDHITNAFLNMSESKTGALLVFASTNLSESLSDSGVTLNADISQSLIENLFYDKAPLHDGAVLISDNKIKAASVILPVSGNNKLPKKLGLRHRAGVGITEKSNSAAFIVSEETGQISYAFEGKLKHNIAKKEIKKLLNKHLNNNN